MTFRNSNNSIDVLANNITATETLVLPVYTDTSQFPNVNTLDIGTLIMSKNSDKLYYVSLSGSQNAYYELSTSSLPPGSFWTQLPGGALQNTNPNGNVNIPNTLSANQVSATTGSFQSMNSTTGTITTFNSTTSNISTLNATTSNLIDIINTSLTSTSISLSGPNAKLLFNNDPGRYIGKNTGNNAIVISNHGNNRSVELETQHVSIGQNNNYEQNVALNIQGKKNNFNNIQVKLKHDDNNSGIGYLMTPDNNFNIACNNQSKMNLGYLTGGNNGVFVSQMDFSPNLNTVNVNGNLTLNGQGLAPPLWFEGPPSTIFNTVNKVLIGTNSSTESEKLIVKDSQLITSGGNSILRQKAYNSVYTTEIVDYGGEWNVRSADPNKFFSFSPSGTERLRISTTGIVNISGTLTINNQPVDFNDEWALTGSNVLYNKNLTGQVIVGGQIPNPNGKFEVKADNTNITPCQLVISGETTGTNQLLIGFDTTQEYGSVQAFKQGVGNRPLCLQPLAGGVGIGITGPAHELDVSGSIQLSSQLIFPATNDTARLQPWSTTFGGVKVVNNTSTDLFHVTDGGDASVHQSLYVNNNALFLQSTTPLTINETQAWDGVSLLPTIETNNGVVIIKGIHIPNGNQLRMATQADAGAYYDLEAADTNTMRFQRNTTTTSTNVLDIAPSGIILSSGIARGGVYFGSNDHGIERPDNTNKITIKTTGNGNIETDLGNSGGCFQVKNSTATDKIQLVANDNSLNYSLIRFYTQQGTAQGYFGAKLGGNDIWMGSDSGDLYLDAGSGKRTYIDNPVADSFYYNKKEDPAVVRESCIITPVIFVWDGSVVQFGATPTITSITRNSVGYYTITYKMSAAGSFRTCIGAREGIATAFTACDISNDFTTDVYTYNNAGTLQDVRTSVIRFVYDNGT